MFIRARRGGEVRGQDSAHGRHFSGAMAVGGGSVGGDEFFELEAAARFNTETSDRILFALICADLTLYQNVHTL